MPPLATAAGTSTPRAPHGMSIDEFEVIKPISRGAFGRVYLAMKKSTKDLFAIKVMRKKDLVRKNMQQSVNNEKNILAMANNPFVVRFYYRWDDRVYWFTSCNRLAGYIPCLVTRRLMQAICSHRMLHVLLSS